MERVSSPRVSWQIIERIEGSMEQTHPGHTLCYVTQRVWKASLLERGIIVNSQSQVSFPLMPRCLQWCMSTPPGSHACAYIL